MKYVEGDLFWSRLGELMMGVVHQRWNLINIFMKSYFEPYVVKMVTLFEWLAEDVEKHFAELTESLKRLDEAEYFQVYWSWLYKKVSQYLVCSSKSTETLLAESYTYFFATFGYFEPSLTLFDAQSLCHLFDACTEGRNVQELLVAAKLKEAVIELYSIVLKIRSALICNSEQAWKTYWQYVLF